MKKEFSAVRHYRDAIVSTDIMTTNDGNITWLFSAIFKSSCQIRVRYYPFDDQVIFSNIGIDAVVLAIIQHFKKPRDVWVLAIMQYFKKPGDAGRCILYFNHRMISWKNLSDLTNQRSLNLAIPFYDTIN